MAENKTALACRRGCRLQFPIQSSAARFVRPRYFYVAPDVHRIKRVRMQLLFDNWIGEKTAACVGYLRLGNLISRPSHESLLCAHTHAYAVEIQV